MASLQPTPTYAAPVIPDKVAPLGEEETVDDTEGAALTLEHLAFGRSRAIGGHTLPHFTGRYPSGVGKSAPNQGYHLVRSNATSSPLHTISPSYQDVTVQNNPLGHGQSPLGREERRKHIDKLLDLLGPTDIFDLVYRQTDVVTIALTKVLPTRERGEILVRAVSHALTRLTSVSRSCRLDTSVHPRSYIPPIVRGLVGLACGERRARDFASFHRIVLCRLHGMSTQCSTDPSLEYNSWTRLNAQNTLPRTRPTSCLRCGTIRRER